uniref:Uncharacterized protein n=1 Tax=Pristionchus pacificus TaxID=54126 RepID=A0A2A6CT67_PRIPA|eukprot:PDM81310.1 hypothetical protein PRIPAC_36313 [Pristionchus pacificus]
MRVDTKAGMTKAMGTKEEDGELRNGEEGGRPPREKRQLKKEKDERDEGRRNSERRSEGEMMPWGVDPW